jgi:hypothetical protein
MPCTKQKDAVQLCWWSLWQGIAFKDKLKGWSGVLPSQLDQCFEGCPVLRWDAEGMKVEGICQVRELPGSCQASPINAREVYHEGQIVQGGPWALAWDVRADKSWWTACTSQNNAR